MFVDFFSKPAVLMYPEFGQYRYTLKPQTNFCFAFWSIHSLDQTKRKTNELVKTTQPTSATQQNTQEKYQIYG
ncbi:Uncharacterized protein APZ42_028153 [Daphnia magna]|uniref:Uncharacterized protein n=1 Tax=Daphnia magna TaxID=35525 RepID=A0A164QS96_9CRUS|nr:Uncharacterized protein APZ42_028153 [Daphnia magna]